MKRMRRETCTGISWRCTLVGTLPNVLTVHVFLKVEREKCIPDNCAAGVATQSADVLALARRFVCSCCSNVEPRRFRLKPMNIMERHNCLCGAIFPFKLRIGDTVMKKCRQKNEFGNVCERNEKAGNARRPVVNCLHQNRRETCLLELSKSRVHQKEKLFYSHLHCKSHVDCREKLA